MNFDQFCCSVCPNCSQNDAWITGVCLSFPAIPSSSSFLCHSLFFTWYVKVLFSDWVHGGSFSLMVLGMNFRGRPLSGLCGRGDAEVGPLPFDVKFSCICRSQCQLRSSFIVFVNLYARVLVSEAPDVDFKYFILFSRQYGQFVTHCCLHHLTVQWVF